MDGGVDDALPPDPNLAWLNLEDVSERLELPAGTVVHPEECGFVLPEGRYLRLYENGLREEQPDGLAADDPGDLHRTQVLAHRIRIGGNPHGFEPHRPVSYETAIAVVVKLPATLATMDDDGLVELVHLIMQAIVDLELKFAVEDGDIIAELAGGRPYAHVIDLSFL